MLAKAALHVELRSLVEIPEEKVIEDDAKKSEVAEQADIKEVNPPSAEKVKTDV